LANPALHVQRYEWIDVLPVAIVHCVPESTQALPHLTNPMPSASHIALVESVQTAPFAQGKLAHSSTSISQLPALPTIGHRSSPPTPVTSRLSSKEHSLAYSPMKPYPQIPLAKPAMHVQRYA
jgi:hypothetical protein